MNKKTVTGGCGDNLTWSLDTKSGVLTISGTGAAEYCSWKDYRSQIKTAVIKEGVTSIGERAFSGCSGLTSVTIPESVISIGYEAFRHCTGLTSITIPNSVTSIGEGAFAYCSGLTSVTIPESVTSIGEAAFFGCSGLTGITIPESVTSIGEAAFFGCSGLTSVTIGDGVTSIGEDAFSGCSGLTGFAVSEGNARYAATDGVLFSKDRDTLIAYPNAKAATYVIPDGVTCIGVRAFSDCDGLTSITIPNSVTSIGEWAFSGCSGLTGFAVSEGNARYAATDGVLFSKDRDTLIAYPNAKADTYYVIPDGVTSIGDYAFSGCRGLREIHSLNPAPPSVVSSAFSGVSVASCRVYVPSGAIAAYQAAGGWKEFANILEEERERE